MPRQTSSSAILHKNPNTLRPVIAAAALLMISLCGCADWGFQRIRLGQGPGTYERALPADGSRHTDLGLCYLKTDAFGQTDAMVILLNRQQQVAAKLQATHYRRQLGFKVDTGFWLRGELDPELIGLSATGPIDTLRAIADDLLSYRGEKLAMDAHAWIAAGLVRLMQRWPHVSDPGLRGEGLIEMLDRVPGAGLARISIDENGVYHFEYRQGTTR